MEIRVMELGDYDQAYALWSGIAGMGLRSLDDSREGIEKFLLRNPGLSFVAIQDGRMAGAILCGQDGRRGYIYHAAVNPSCRRQGIGNRLVQQVIQALQKVGINKSALVVFSDNQIGNAFWEKMGYTVRTDLTYRNKSINRDNR